MEQASVIVPERSVESLREAGWARDANGFGGEFRTPAGSWPGRIEWRDGFLAWVREPPAWLRFKVVGDGWGFVPLRARCEDPLLAKWRSDDVLQRRVQRFQGREFSNQKEQVMDGTRIIEEKFDRTDALRVSADVAGRADGLATAVNLLTNATGYSAQADQEEARNRRLLAKRCMKFFAERSDFYYGAGGAKRFWTAGLAGQSTAAWASTAALADLQRVMDEVAHVEKNQASVKGDQVMQRLLVLIAAVPSLLAAGAGQQQRLIEGVRSVMRVAEPEREPERNGAS